jgi:hypothetical protein
MFGRRYIAGGLGGYIAGKCCYPDAYCRGLWLHYAKLFSHWSNFLLAADGAIDSNTLTRDASSTLLYSLFQVMSGSLVPKLNVSQIESIDRSARKAFGIPMTSSGSQLPKFSECRLEWRAAWMAKEVGNDCMLLWKFHKAIGQGEQFKTAIGEFLDKSIELAEGQLNSLDQRLLDYDHDWAWYRAVMNGKTLNVLQALLPLFLGDKASNGCAGQDINRWIVAVNDAFCHRQLLDDLLDFDEDMQQHTANAIQFLIISQGRIAQAADKYFRTGEVKELALEFQRSFAICPDFAVEFSAKDGGSDLTEAKCLPENVILDLVRQALVNDPCEHDVSLKEIVEIRLQHATDLIGVWARREYDEVRRIVNSSRIVNRILIGLPRRGPIDRLKSMQACQSMPPPVRMFFVRCVRTLNKCRAAWHVGAPIAGHL